VAVTVRPGSRLKSGLDALYARQGPSGATFPLATALGRSARRGPTALGEGAHPRPDGQGLAPEDPRVSDTLGWIFYRRGVHQRALALLKDSAAKRPGNPQIQYHLGMVSAQLGDTEAAHRALSIAAAAPTPFPGQDEAKKALAALR